MIADERRTLADLIEGLDERQARTPSLCSEWTVHDVGAHLLMPLVTSTGKLISAMLASAGNFNKANVKLTAAVAQRSNAELAAGLRQNARHPFKPPAQSHGAPLTDLLVHGQDIRRPLGLGYQPKPEAVQAAFGFLSSGKSKGSQPKGVVHVVVRYEPTDVDGSLGSGAVSRVGSQPAVAAHRPERCARRHRRRRRCHASPTTQLSRRPKPARLDIRGSGAARSSPARARAGRAGSSSRCPCRAGALTEYLRRVRGRRPRADAATPR